LIFPRICELPRSFSRKNESIECGGNFADACDRNFLERFFFPRHSIKAHEIKRGSSLQPSGIVLDPKATRGTKKKVLDRQSLPLTCFHELRAMMSRLIDFSIGLECVSYDSHLRLESHFYAHNTLSAHFSSRRSRFTSPSKAFMFLLILRCFGEHKSDFLVREAGEWEVYRCSCPSCHSTMLTSFLFVCGEQGSAK
jgi:hypothetical protein